MIVTAVPAPQVDRPDAVRCCVETAILARTLGAFARWREPVPKKRMAPRMIKELIRLKWEAQLTHDRIDAVLKVSKGVVVKYVALASAAGLD